MANLWYEQPLRLASKLLCEHRPLQPSLRDLPNGSPEVPSPSQRAIFISTMLPRFLCFEVLFVLVSLFGFFFFQMLFLKRHQLYPVKNSLKNLRVVNILKGLSSGYGIIEEKILGYGILKKEQLVKAIPQMFAHLRSDRKLLCSTTNRLHYNQQMNVFCSKTAKLDTTGSTSVREENARHPSCYDPHFEIWSFRKTINLLPL